MVYRISFEDLRWLEPSQMTKENDEIQDLASVVSNSGTIEHIGISGPLFDLSSGLEEVLSEQRLLNL